MRKITSIILALAFIIVALTGVQMDFSHSGGDRSKPPAVQSMDNGNNIAVKASNVPRQVSFYPKVAHEWAGYLFIIAGLMHLLLNIKPMQSYLRIRR